MDIRYASVLNGSLGVFVQFWLIFFSLVPRLWIIHPVDEHVISEILPQLSPFGNSGDIYKEFFPLSNTHERFINRMCFCSQRAD